MKLVTLHCGIAVVVTSTALACAPRVQPAPTPAPTIAPSAAAEVPLGNEDAIVQARVGIGARDATPSSWIDFEVGGPASSAMRVCRALVAREQRVSLPPEIAVTVRRACATDALVEPGATSAYSLVLIERPGSIEMTMTLGDDAPKDDVARVRVRRRALTAYRDEAACNEMLAKMREAARRRGGDAALDFLTTQIEREKRVLEKECSAGVTERCKQSRQVVELLERKKAEGLDASTPDSVSAYCHRR